VALREKQKRNLLGTLLLSQGVPMICGGDERGRSQRGNNNAYCQDNEISWLNWDLNERDAQLLEFAKHLIQLRKEHPVLLRRRFFQGRAIRGGGIRDIAWFQPDGSDMSEEAWDNGLVRTLGMRLNGMAIDETDERGERIIDDILLLLINGHDEKQSFKLPGPPESPRWEVLLDTNTPHVEETRSAAPGEIFELHPRTLVMLRQPKEEL
jgi:glycogen operon protein